MGRILDEIKVSVKHNSDGTVTTTQTYSDGRVESQTQLDITQATGPYKPYVSTINTRDVPSKWDLENAPTPRPASTPPTEPLPDAFSNPIEIKESPVTTVDLTSGNSGPSSSDSVFSLPSSDDISAGLTKVGDTFQTGVSAVGTYVNDTATTLYDNASNAISEVSTFIPGSGNFSVTSLAQKGGEMVSSLVSGGVTDAFSKLFKKDVSGVLKKAGISSKSSASSALARQASATPASADSLFVTLSSDQNPTTDTFVLNVMPNITETRDASYEEVGITHHPGQILRYKSTGVRNWGIESKLISRTPAEAAKNLWILNLVRSWVMPYYGFGTAAEGGDYLKRLGAPPDIINFSAYGIKMIQKHPTVLTNYSTSFPNEIDYIDTEPDKDGKVYPFPVILTLSLQLKEAWSPKEFSSFNLREYKEGYLRKAFSGNLPTPENKSVVATKKEASPIAGEVRPSGGALGQVNKTTQSEAAFAPFNSVDKVRSAVDTAFANVAENTRLENLGKLYQDRQASLERLKGHPIYQSFYDQFK